MSFLTIGPGDLSVPGGFFSRDTLGPNNLSKSIFKNVDENVCFGKNSGYGALIIKTSFGIKHY